MQITDPLIGAHFLAGRGTLFCVWAPFAKKVEVVLDTPERQVITMQENDHGHWRVRSELAKPGTRYMYRLNEELERPDPASRSQPAGVHGVSEVIDQQAFSWTDQQWKGMPLRKMIIYELHVGTFTDQGTFDGVIEKLLELVDLGITAIEIMPVAQFPGERNWGYDGVHPFAVQHSYGGAEGLKRLVDACHDKGLAVILDVVYNHLGPEGNYLNDFGPYFTDKYRTPWGTAINFDDAHSDHVRNFFIQNALMWLRDFHIDALRLDAVHAILDTSAKPFLQELHEHKDLLEKETGKQYALIAESDLSDRRLIDPIEKGGYGLEGQWMDDLHHAIHALITGERDGYYHDFGTPDHLLKALEHSFVFNGTYSEYRKRTVGTNASDVPADRFVVCIQNHDQVGNRMLGERLSQLIDHEMLKVAAGIYILSPYVPLLFMGEEYGEEAPFLYFVSHGDKALMEAVRKGRREEFRSFSWKGEAPDPGAQETFDRSKLKRGFDQDPQKREIREFYKRLIGMKRTHPALMQADKHHLEVKFSNGNTVLHMLHTGARPHLYALFNLSDSPQPIGNMAGAEGFWHLLLDSSVRTGQYNGEGPAIDGNDQIILAPMSMIVLQNESIQ